MSKWLRKTVYGVRLWLMTNGTPIGSPCERMGKDCVGRVISDIGEQAGVVVRKADERRKHRVKYASAHDIRRGFAQRLVNAGLSMEMVTMLMRHADFATTRKHYAGARAVQSAALDLPQQLSAAITPAFVGGLKGGTGTSPQLSETEAAKLKALLASL